MDKKLSTEGSRRTLLVLFIPSVERDGVTPISQDVWVDAALVVLGELFGGATAYPKARGIWRDDERGGALIKDEPVVIHCYTSPELINDELVQAQLESFCRKMGRETNQGEIGLVIDNQYYPLRDFSEE